MKLLAGDLEPAHGRGHARRDGQARLPLPGHGRDPRPPARARVRRGRSRAAPASATAPSSRPGCCASASASAARRAARWSRTCRGGERRRLQLMRLLMGEPNVLLLDEPTNDLDIDTLTALEDLLDGWPGTLVVVSHDRYFVERVCDNVYALTGDGKIRHLPGGIEQYLELRRPEPEPESAALGARRPQPGRRPRRAQGGRPARTRAGEARRARGDAAHRDGGGGDRPRAPARAPARAHRERRGTRAPGDGMARSRGGRRLSASTCLPLSRTTV